MQAAQRLSVLFLSLLLMPSCFVAAEAGVAMPVSGPVKSSPTTSLGVAIGFAFDLGPVLLGAGTGVVVHEVTRDSGETDEIVMLGSHFRTDLTLSHSTEPIFSGANFGKIFRATSTLRFGGCRKLDINSMTPEDGCEDSRPWGDGMLVSMGALAGIRSDKGDVLSISLSPYYTRSKHATEPTIGLGGVMARISLSGVPKMFSGLATLSSNYDWEADRRRRTKDADLNERRGNAMRCKGTLEKDKDGKTYCKER